MQETSVVLGLEDPVLQEEVLHFLDRLPRVTVVGATGEPSSLARQVRSSRPDAAVVSPGLAEGAVDLDGAALLVLAPRETTQGLRAALRAGARGFYVWPDERDALRRDAERAARRRSPQPTTRGRVVAVYGPRGGVGVTFVATNLAAACADLGVDVALADLDTMFADVTAALAVAGDPDVPTMADLSLVHGELTDEHLDRVLQPGPRGFEVLLAPHEPAPPPPPEAVVETVRMLRSRFDLVLLHLPRVIDDPTRAAIEEADDVLLVLSLDVLALRDAKRAMEFLAGAGLEARLRVVVNRASRGDLVPADVQRVLGRGPDVLIPRDSIVPRAQNRGELLAGKSRPAAKRIRALARQLIDGGER